ncbi:dTDP-4-dehydrorhamnose 3,5-epimerase [Sulfurimonas diazotrophicus]|uniref:dTDP-4-dehydrorhamnose 3,5-epimerase n=1 Tax=Sulfurimonas diazotrophicus TaxID=3131939 RepID=A0ABZ3HB24_9BACT
MHIIETAIPEVVIIEPRVIGDERGYFFESFNNNKFCESVVETKFVQDNESKSRRGVLRGLHYQIPPFCQSKLARVVQGSALDVAVDIRKGSPTFGQHVAVVLSAENKRQLFIPRGFAHAVITLSDEAIFQYKVDNFYSFEHERGVSFQDDALNIDWHMPYEEIIVSEKDAGLPTIASGNAYLFDYSKDYYQ